MYESYFGFSHRPFPPGPSAEAYVATTSIEQARQTLVRCIDRCEGPAIVVGPAGTGKSLLCQLLTKQFRGRFHVALLSGARLATRRALLQNILFELRLPYRDLDEGELRLSLVDHLEPRSGGPDGLLLLIDEAHTLPLRLLEEARLLTNLIRGGQARVRLVLAGGMALEEKLASPKLESFQQRIAARCYLQPLPRQETERYIGEQLQRAGGKGSAVFSSEAQAAVHTATDGIPRLINQVCDHALLLAALGGHEQLQAAGIEEAWADLQQLPVPLAEPPVLSTMGASRGNSVVEFGELAEERSAVAGSIRPSVADAAMAGLEAIDHTLDALQNGERGAGVITGTAADDFSPTEASGTEVELFFHTAHDPFGGHWEEEEIVIDRFASLEDQAVRNRQRSTTSEARAMSAAVSAALTPAETPQPQLSLTIAGPTPGVAPAGPAGGEAFREEPSAMGATLVIPSVAMNEATPSAGGDFHPANDPLLPEESEVAATPASVLRGRSRRATVSLAELERDDRDMIVVDDESIVAREALEAARPRRAAYRQLFSSLRNR